jgi:hypothetical protein
MVGVEFVCMTGDGALYKMLEPEMAMLQKVSSLMTQLLKVLSVVKSEAKKKVFEVFLWLDQKLLYDPDLLLKMMPRILMKMRELAKNIDYD